MATAEIQHEWSSKDMMSNDLNGTKSLLPALPLDNNSAQSNDSDVGGIETKINDLGINTPPSSSPVRTSRSSTGVSYPSPPPMNHSSKPTIDSRQSSSPICSALFTEQPTNGSKLRNVNLPTPLQTHSLTGQHNMRTPSATYSQSPTSMFDSTASPNPVQPWMSGNPGSPRHGPLLTPSTSSPALTPHPTSSYGGSSNSSNSLPLPGTLTPANGSRKNSVASLSGQPRISPGFRGAPLGQTSDTESVLKQFDVYFGKVYLKGQLQKKNELGVEGFKLQGQQWAAYNAELIGPKLRLRPLNSANGTAEEMNMEEATVEMQDGPNGGTFTVNWMGANKVIFQPVQQLSLGSPEIGSSCQDWVCAIRLSCYECSRLQEIYTSTLLRRPKFRDQVAATIEGPIKAEGMLRVKFWAGDEWQRLYVVVSDQRGDEIKKKKQGKVLQAAPIRGHIHFYESPKAKRPFVSMYNVSQAYAVCPSRSTLNASKDNKIDEEGSLTIKLEGDVVMQRENLTASRKGFFSSPTPPSLVARDLQALMPTGRSMFAMLQVPNAVERTKFLLGTSEAFRIYGKPGPLLFDSPTDPSAMNFGCMASSLLQQELLIGLDAVIHLPQKGESLADVKFSFGEVLRKRLIAENPSAHRGSISSYTRRHSTMPPIGCDGYGPPSPMLSMAMRSRANSGSTFLVPQPSPGLHPAHMSPWAGSPHSPQIGPYSATSSPRQGPLHTATYGPHHRSPYPPSSASTDENDANLMTDEEGEDDDYPDTPEEDEDGNITPYRSRSGSLMVSSGIGYQSRQGSIGALSVHSGRAGRSGSFTSAYGVPLHGFDAPKKKTVLELPSLNSFSDDFGIREDANNQKQKKLTAVVYPTQIVIPKNKKRKDSVAGESGLRSTFPTPGGAASPSIMVNSQDITEEPETETV
ncbi:hypothetical protein BGZ76_006322 [Entomortierella beljakovae]|nr:hypothetical protein BGZ76_006322 [Entomortierella beljakovae]